VKREDSSEGEDCGGVVSAERGNECPPSRKKKKKKKFLLEAHPPAGISEKNTDLSKMLWRGGGGGIGLEQVLGGKGRGGGTEAGTTGEKSLTFFSGGEEGVTEKSSSYKTEGKKKRKQICPGKREWRKKVPSIA